MNYDRIASVEIAIDGGHPCGKQAFPVGQRASRAVIDGDGASAKVVLQWSYGL